MPKPRVILSSPPVVVEAATQEEEAPPRPRAPRMGWPYADPDSLPMPKTLPGGEPWPRISVVTPSYNQGEYIEETILSVLQQGYPDVEHIVVDGGSTDSTRDVLDRYRDRLARVIIEPDEGQSDAINKGMALATGSILTWLNSDDMLAPGALAAVALALRQSNADMVAGECRVYKEGKLSHRHITSCDDGPMKVDEVLDLERRWMVGQFFYQPEVMFTRELWERAGARVDTRWRYSMDYELWLRFAEAGARLKVIGRPIAHFRAHDEQKTAEATEGGFRAELPKVVADFRERTARAPAEPADSPAALKRSLRIVLFNDMGYAYGAGIAHRRIARALTEAGHDVRALSAGQIPWTTGADAIRAIASHSPDLVIVGNIHAAELAPGLVGRIADRFPTAFMLHDLWMLTGGCAYPGECDRYVAGCSRACSCPDAYPKPEPTELSGEWEQKRHVLGARSAPMLLANSRWTQSRVSEALAAGVEAGTLPDAPPVDWIRFGIELDAFRPRDRGTCRDLLGLPRDQFIVMTSASSFADTRKGLAHLVEAMQSLDLPDALVIAAGHRRAGEDVGLPLHWLGYVRDPTHLAMAYAAADIFVGPSLEEAFGQVFIEAAACGTPSVGYSVGGVPEAISHGVSGLLAAEVSPGALAEAIRALHEDPGLRRDLGLWGRRWVESNYSMAASAHRLITALRGLGVPLERKLSLACEDVEVIESIHAPVQPPFWVGVEGLAPWEGPLREHKLDRFRWALGPISILRATPESPGKHDLILRVRNFHKGQRLRIVREGQTVLEQDVPVTGHKRDHVVQARIPLRRGATTIELHHWKWQADNPARPIALLIQDLVLVRAP